MQKLKVPSAKDAAHGGVAKGPSSTRSSGLNSSKKAKFCMYHLQGVCKYAGDACAFAHSMEEMERSRRAKKGQSATGKQAQAMKSGRGTMIGSKLGSPNVSVPSNSMEQYWSRLDPHPATPHQQSFETWPELEPMFVETLPMVKSGLTDALLPFATELPIPHDGLGAPWYERLGSELAKSEEDLVTDLAAMISQLQLNASAAQQVHFEDGTGSTLQACQEGLALNSAHHSLPAPGVVEVTRPVFYTMPNPFIRVAEKRGVCVPVVEPSSGSDQPHVFGA
jgi:hypothetical protein